MNDEQTASEEVAQDEPEATSELTSEAEAQDITEAAPSEPEPTHAEPIDVAVSEPEVAAEAESEAAAVEALPEVAPAVEAPPVSNKKWYIIKVTSGREDSIKAAIERRVRIEGLEPFFGQLHIPVEKIVEVKKVKEKRNGETVTKERRVTKERKKFPGYVMAEVEFNDQILYLFRETNGVADFVGGASATKPPTPMEELDIKRMMGDAPVDAEQGGTAGRKKTKTVIKLEYEKGDKVRIREGVFANMVGEVKSIMMPKDSGEAPQVTVVVEVIGRPIDVTLEYWQVDKV
jgi:transcription termination/antitermination protein NusG